MASVIMVKIKFNGGLGAVLCEGCHVILGTAKDFPHYFPEGSPNEHLFCSEECKKKYLEHIEKQCRIIKKW